MPLTLRNGTFGTSSADCDVIRQKFFRFFRRFWVRIARSFQEAQKKGGSFLDSEFLIEIRQISMTFHIKSLISESRIALKIAPIYGYDWTFCQFWTSRDILGNLLTFWNMSIWKRVWNYIFFRKLTFRHNCGEQKHQRSIFQPICHPVDSDRRNFDFLKPTRFYFFYSSLQ